MIVQRIETDLLKSNMYIVVEGTGAVVIDPGRNTEMQDGITPELIFLTHEHYDHISGVNAWKEKYRTQVICSRECGERVQSSKRNMARYFQAFCELQTGLDNTVPEDYDPEYVCIADRVYAEDTVLSWRNHTIRFMLLPGHSPGSAGIVIDDCLFSGDSIFIRQNTVLNFPGGSEEDWKLISLPKLKALKKETIVYPGHFSSFTLEDWEPYKEETNGLFCQSRH